jgi:hypothetical protein
VPTPVRATYIAAHNNTGKIVIIVKNITPPMAETPCKTRKKQPVEYHRATVSGNEIATLV